ncbi:DUF4760 domain-containing protein [Actinomadura litoris]|uniref:DUF4760 domain-containing protein n=1 Tax=Actinomadura litoris TaxID=2678616 RepID=UPI001FA7484E|nr:DUF4760 domain-containing protein [Actinomadura litoris]
MSTLLNVAALIIAACALILSTLIALRQSLLQERANASSALLTLLSEYRSPAFHKRYEYVCQRLAQEHSPDVGLSGLPEDAQEAVYDIVYHYMDFSTLVGLGILNEREVLALVRRRVTAVWDAIAPYIAREQELNPSAGTFSFLEALAAHARTLPPGQGTLALQWSRRGRWTRQRLLPKHWRLTYLERAQAERARQQQSSES